MQCRGRKAHLPQEESDKLGVTASSAEDNTARLVVLLPPTEQELDQVGVPRLGRGQNEPLVQLVHGGGDVQVWRGPHEGIVGTRFYHSADSF